MTRQIVLRLGILAATVLCLLAPAACAPDPAKSPCKDADRACASRELQRHPIRRLDTWKPALALPVAERIGPAPADLVQYLTLDSIANGLKERPRVASPDASFLADVRGAIADLPPDIWRLFSDRLLGIFFVEDLGGTGYTDVVFDSNNRAAAGFIVLDAGVLKQQTANGWATWKENTPFKVQTAVQLVARIESDALDTRRNAIQYILLHELGHVLSIGRAIHPPWTLQPKDVPDQPTYPFFDLSWKIDRAANVYASRFDADFAHRKDVRYYFGARLSGSDMLTTYEQLERTNFPTLYAATSPGDDFAEAFASYVHVVRMQRPWQITIARKGEVVKTVQSCWSEPRCADKRRYLDTLLK